MAEKIDMSEKNLGNIEKGKQFPQINNFFRLLEVLNLSTKDFGVNANEKSNEKRDELIQKIYLLGENEIEIYSKLIDFADSLAYKK